jgi:hypothetical protein
MRNLKAFKPYLAGKKKKKEKCDSKTGTGTNL